MKLKISSIEETTFTVREKLDTEYLTELKTSLNEDGQWDSVIQPRVTEFLREAEKEISESSEELKIEIPDQPEFFKTPVGFGTIPVDILPLGCDKKQQYKKLYPKISLPFQQVEKISFGHPDLQPNRLIFGDNLHIMRMLPSNSIDLIYIDPPFFSGRNYNVLFGDQNEVRSFTDIWEGGMPGYITWLNARLLEMKRLLKPTGLIYVHVDWHASHYVKVELDKIFGYDNFRNEIVWCYAGGGVPKKDFPRKHDVIFRYSKSDDYCYKAVFKPYTKGTIERGRTKVKGDIVLRKEGTPLPDWWISNLECDKCGNKLIENIKRIASPTDPEKIGYPTQKSEALLERITTTSSNPGEVVADFFCGGGTTPVVAQKLGRRWIACDISRIAVSVTRDRLLREFLSKDKKAIQQSLEKVPDISIEHWGVL